MEQFSNNASTTLNGAITSGATSLIVTSATGFPSTGNFRILIESEIMLVTNVAGTNFTVTRGIEGTTAVGHANGVSVFQTLTSGALIQGIKDYAPFQPPVFGSLAVDVTVTGQASLAGTWTDLVTVTASGTAFLIQAHVAGASAAGSTLALRAQVDGSTVVTTYGNTGQGGGQTMTGDVLYQVTGLLAGSHTIKIQGIGLTTNILVNALTALGEGAWLVATPLT